MIFSHLKDEKKNQSLAKQFSLVCYFFALN